MRRDRAKLAPEPEARLEVLASEAVALGLAADAARGARLASAQVGDRVPGRKAPGLAEGAAAMAVDVASAAGEAKTAAAAASSVVVVMSSAAKASSVANALAEAPVSDSFRPIAARSSGTASAGAGASSTEPISSRLK